MRNHYFPLFFTGLIFLAACSNNAPEAGSGKAGEGLLDSLMPFVAKLHDSIPDSAKFAQVHKAFMVVHKQERQYCITHFAESADEGVFLIIRRLEPSINKDKFASICVHFKRNKAGAVDTASFREVFRTWKMKEEVLGVKTDVLFEKALKGADLSTYYPENNREEWIEFPGNGAVYNTRLKKWMAPAVK